MKNIIKDLIKKYIFWIFIEILLLALNVYLVTLPSEFLGRIIDLLYNIEVNKKAILNTTIMLLVACVAILITRVSWKMIDAKVSRETVKILRDRLFDKMLRADVFKLQSIKNGKIMSYFVSDIKEIRKFISKAFTVIARFFLNFTIVAWAMCKSTNWKMTIISLIPIFLSIVSILIIIKKLEKNYKESREKFTKLSEYVQESTDSIRTTKAYHGEKSQYNEFLRKNKEMKKINMQVIKNEALLNLLINIGIGIGTGLAIYYGGNLVLSGEISTGDFVAFNSYILLLYPQIVCFPWVLKHVKKVKVSYARLNNMFNLEEETYLNKEQVLEGNIEINNLTYSYPNTDEPVLKDINISIKKGKSLGIIGVIGSGKTTLMNLLLKLYKVPEGHIFIDGIDINNIDTNIIRNNICYITQDNFLFSASVKENINLYRDIYDEDDIYESTKLSMIYDEVKQMANEIDTVVGEKGIDLSGGQKQRVVLSRAFLSNSNVVIFDDNFSALDNKTEEKVLENIRKSTEDKTCIIVSNRISDIKHCDEIVVLEQGKIVERGVHEDLLKNKYKYFEFYKNQVKKSKGDWLE